MMITVRRTLAAAVAACALLSGCSDPGDGATDRTETAVEPDPDAGTPSAGTEPTDTSPAAPPPTSGAAAAVADLAGTLGVDPGSVEVVSVEEVTWRDGSLGCAQEGMRYTQALVDGSRIVLRVDGTEYEYHAGRGAPFHCPRPTQ
jgi:hypothetical protein